MTHSGVDRKFSLCFQRGSFFKHVWLKNWKIKKLKKIVCHYWVQMRSWKDHQSSVSFLAANPSIPQRAFTLTFSFSSSSQLRLEDKTKIFSYWFKSTPEKLPPQSHHAITGFISPLENSSDLVFHTSDHLLRNIFNGDQFKCALVTSDQPSQVCIHKVGYINIIIVNVSFSTNETGRCYLFL